MHSKVIHCRVSHVIRRSESQVVHSLAGSATHDPKKNRRGFLEMFLYHIFFGVLSFYTIPYKIQLPYIKHVLNSLKFQKKTCDGFDIETAIVQSGNCIKIGGGHLDVPTMNGPFSGYEVVIRISCSIHVPFMFHWGFPRFPHLPCVPEG